VMTALHSALKPQHIQNVTQFVKPYVVVGHAGKD